MGEEGHTHIVSQLFLAGAAQAGAKVHTVQLANHDIKQCQGCGDCFYKTPGKCKLNDDGHKLLKRFMDSDVAVFATPLYFNNVSALTKTFIDRLYPLFEPHCEKGSDGLYRRRKRFEKYPKIMVISSCRLPEQSNFDVLRLFFRKLASTFDTELAGEIYLSSAGLLFLAREDVKFKAVINEYNALLHQAGRDFVRAGKISDEQAAKLSKLLIAPDEYVEYANAMWDQLLEKHQQYSVLA